MTSRQSGAGNRTCLPAARNRKLHTGNRNSEGFTLVEVMLTLTILALLMAAVGVAVRASIGGFTENEKLARAMQAARSVLDRVARQLRTAQGIDFTQTVDGQYDVTTLIVSSPRDGGGLAEVRYVYKKPQGGENGKLYYQYQKEGEQLQTPESAMLGEEDDLAVTSFDITLITEDSRTRSAKVELRLTVADRALTSSVTTAVRGWGY